MIPIKILTQPDETTCGPTSLHAIYEYYGDSIPLEKVIAQVPCLKGGGTLAVMLACHALKRGYQAVIYTYNLTMFDPTWYAKDINISKKLKEQARYKKNAKLLLATAAYLEFIKLGGQFCFDDLNPRVLKKYFRQGTPILTGLSASYLYRTAREYTKPDGITIPSDVRGYPVGHFVVLGGYDKAKHHVIVADPYAENTISHNNYYAVRIGRLINSILLGAITYDANFLIIKPRNS